MYSAVQRRFCRRLDLRSADLGVWCFGERLDQFDDVVELREVFVEVSVVRSRPIPPGPSPSPSQSGNRRGVSQRYISPRQPVLQCPQRPMLKDSNSALTLPDRRCCLASRQPSKNPEKHHISLVFAKRVEQLFDRRLLDGLNGFCFDVNRGPRGLRLGHRVFGLLGPSGELPALVDKPMMSNREGPRAEARFISFERL